MINPTWKHAPQQSGLSTAHAEGLAPQHCAPARQPAPSSHKPQQPLAPVAAGDDVQLQAAQRMVARLAGEKIALEHELQQASAAGRARADAAELHYAVVQLQEQLKFRDTEACFSQGSVCSVLRPLYLSSRDCAVCADASMPMKFPRMLYDLLRPP
jgi:hypothetical protein